MKRKKAFWGAAIGAAASMINTGLQIAARNKELKEKQRLTNEQNNINYFSSLNQSINGSQDAAREYYDRVTLMPLGGSTAAGPKPIANVLPEVKLKVPKIKLTSGNTQKPTVRSNNNSENTGEDPSDIINGISSMWSPIYNLVRTPPQSPKLNTVPIFSAKRDSNYISSMYDRLMQQNFRCGGRKKARCGKKI